jgi:hypothetical protein
MPWGPALALAAVVLASDAGLDPATVQHTMTRLHVRWRNLFPLYHLTHFDEWKPAEHLPRYFTDQHVRDTQGTRVEFLKAYGQAAFHTQAYVRGLAVAEQARYARWALPPLPPELERRLGRSRRAVDAAARQRRKAATDALTPHFAQLRYEAHLRWNQLARLRAEYHNAVDHVESGDEHLPLAFSYDETGLQQRLHFVLWNRRSFALAHLDQYSAAHQKRVRRGRRNYHPDREHYFLEFIRAEPLPGARRPGLPGGAADAHVLPQTEGADADLLWFGDLFRNAVIGQAATLGSPIEIAR